MHIDRRHRHEPADKGERPGCRDRRARNRCRARRRAPRPRRRRGYRARPADCGTGPGRRCRRPRARRRPAPPRHARPAHLQDHVLDRGRHAGRPPAQRAREHLDEIGEATGKRPTVKATTATQRPARRARSASPGSGRAGHAGRPINPAPPARARSARRRRHVIEALVEIARQRRAGLPETAPDRESSPATTGRSAG